MTVPMLNLDAMVAEMQVTGATTGGDITVTGIDTTDVVIWPMKGYCLYWTTTDTAPSLVALTITAADTVRTGVDTSAGVIGFTYLDMSAAIQ